jgi:hypothetical protein
MKRLIRAILRPDMERGKFTRLGRTHFIVGKVPVVVNRLLKVLALAGLTGTVYAGTSGPPAGNYLLNSSTIVARPALKVSSASISDLTPGNCVQAGTGGLLTSAASACGSGGGGGSSSLETIFGTARSSPTATIRGDSNFTGSVTGSTMTISLSPNLIVSSITTTGTITLKDNTVITSTSTFGGGSYVRTGYSGRFSEAVNVTLSSQALDQIFEFQYTAPTLTLGTSPGASVNELGTTISNVTLSAYTVEKSSPITIVQWKLNGSVIKSSTTPTSTGGTEVYVDAGPRSTTSAYTATASDNVSTTTSNTVTFTFVYPYYYGVGAQSLSFAAVQGLTKVVQTQQNTATTTSPSAQVYYFAYPQAYGSLSSILDPNGFETISGYTKRSGTMTMLDATVQNYYVYEFNTPTTQTSFTNTYKY